MDTFEEFLEHANLLGWSQIEELDEKQVILLNYGEKFDIKLTALSPYIIVIECSISIRKVFKGLHFLTLLSKIVNGVFKQNPELENLYKWELGKNGDICWYTERSFKNELNCHIVEDLINELRIISKTTWDLYKRLSKLSTLLCEDGIVLPVNNCHEKFKSIGAVVVYLYFFHQEDFARSFIETCLYNISLRNTIRKKGLQYIIQEVCEEFPKLTSLLNWEQVATLWEDMHYSIGNYNIQLQYTFDEYHMFNKTIYGLNETLMMLEFNTNGIEMIYKGKWKYEEMNKEGNEFVYPLLGHQVWIPNEYTFNHRIPRITKRGIHIAEYSNELIINPITKLLENTFLFVFKKHKINIKEVKQMEGLVEDSAIQQIESIPSKQLPALCFFQDKTYMLIITKND
jgi:hypothetical protein